MYIYVKDICNIQITLKASHITLYIVNTNRESLYYISREGFLLVLCYSILPDSLSTPYMHHIFFPTSEQANKNLISLPQVGKGKWKGVRTLPYSVSSQARILNLLLPELSCGAGRLQPSATDSSQATMKIQDLKRTDTLCNYINPYLQEV